MTLNNLVKNIAITIVRLDIVGISTSIGNRYAFISCTTSSIFRLHDGGYIYEVST